MNNLNHDATVECCADCGSVGGGGVSLKTCKSCMSVKYCNAKCQKKHWPTHKKDCKSRATELRDEALFKDPPAKEDCPICFVPMPYRLICCITLPPATISSVPIYDYVKNEATEELANTATEAYFPCCGKSICEGCLYSFGRSVNGENCPYCKSYRMGKTDKEAVAELMKRVEANDAASIYVLGNKYYYGQLGLLRDQAKALELYARAAKLGSNRAHYHLGVEYHQRGDLKKEKFHYEAAAIAGHEAARYYLGCMEFESGDKERAVKHWEIAASGGDYKAMFNLLWAFKQGVVCRDQIDSTLTAYNTSCAKMRSEARDAHIKMCIGN